MKDFLQIVDILLEQNGVEKGTTEYELFSQMYTERASDGEFDDYQKNVLFSKDGILIDSENELTLAGYENALNHCSNPKILNLATNLRQIIESDVTRYCEIHKITDDFEKNDKFILIGTPENLDEKRYQVFLSENAPSYFLARCIGAEQFL